MDARPRHGAPRRACAVRAAAPADAAGGRRWHATRPLRSAPPSRRSPRRWCSSRSCVLFAGVVARYVFHAPLVWSDELAVDPVPVAVDARRGGRAAARRAHAHDGAGRQGVARGARALLDALAHRGVARLPALVHAAGARLRRARRRSSSRRRSRSATPGAPRRMPVGIGADARGRRAAPAARVHRSRRSRSRCSAMVGAGRRRLLARRRRCSRRWASSTWSSSSSASSAAMRVLRRADRASRSRSPPSATSRSPRARRCS